MSPVNVGALVGTAAVSALRQQAGGWQDVVLECDVLN
jgi:hypothetical protein